MFNKSDIDDRIANSFEEAQFYIDRIKAELEFADGISELLRRKSWGNFYFLLF